MPGSLKVVKGTLEDAGLAVEAPRFVVVATGLAVEAGSRAVVPSSAVIN